MRIIDQDLIDNLSSHAYRPAYLFKAEVAGAIFRFTSWSSTVAYGGAIYYSRGMTVGSLGYGSANIANGCSISVDDIDRTFYSVLGSNASEDWECALWIVVLDKYGIVIKDAITNAFTGFITEWTYSSGKINMKLKTAFAKWAGQTTRLFSTSCTVKVFKSPQCGYTGSETRCDRSYETCKSYGNGTNFQGFPWLEDLASRRVDLTGDAPPPAEVPVHFSTPFVGQRR